MVDRRLETAARVSEPPAAAFAFLDFLSVPAAMGTALLVYWLLPVALLGIPLGSFLATLVYNLLLAAQVRVFMSRATGDH